MAGTPEGYVVLHGADSQADPVPTALLLADEGGDLAYTIGGIPLPALREVCYSASVYANLAPASGSPTPRTDHNFCLRRSGCSAVPSSGPAAMLLALLALLARRR